ncbi:hypothetical protein IQ06DRAFT_360007 [Phaeosphaeriaceae sp. SRC1lsM3a]|nr:hypothetical protein IQ06DRAFT_360007 [Stagonospora sp. SRC1lsM3a]
MPSDADVSRFLANKLQQYEDYIGVESAEPALYPHLGLTNDILPMFQKRWVTGPGQCTHKVHERLNGPFKLASRSLMEEYPLKWFTHLLFGDRVTSLSGTYIRGNSYSRSSAPISKVRDVINNVGKLVTFMFNPPNCPMRGNGMTMIPKSAVVREYGHGLDGVIWPRDSRSAIQGKARPTIILNREWLEYFGRQSSPPLNEQCRVMFLFAVTLVHEIAHACNMWLSSAKEPLWSEKDKGSPELGWSWEREIIGYSLDTIDDTFSQGTATRYLQQIKMDEYHTPERNEQSFCASWVVHIGLISSHTQTLVVS